MFERENAFFEANKDILRKQYLGKEIVIAGDRVLGAYNDLGTALRETKKTSLPGTFCVKTVKPDDEEIWIPTMWAYNE